MRKILLLLTILAGATGAARGDTVTVRNIPYANVRVTDAANCKIAYRLNGRIIEKPIKDVNSVHIDNRPMINRAEQFMRAGKAVEAVMAYDAAEASPSVQPWQKRLIRYRRLRALDAAAMVGRAVKEWLAVVDENSASRGSIELAPTRLAKRGSPENARAISLLEARLKQAKTVALIAKIKGLLAALYAAEGKTAKAAAVRSAGTVPAGGGNPPGGAEDVSAAVAGLPARGQLRQAADLINAGRYDEAAEAIRQRLRRYSGRELPAALLLRGKALLLKYEKTQPRDRKTLLEAGLCFMRVASGFDPSYPEVPEALFLAARVCELLGNKVAAQNTYRMLASKFRLRAPKWAQKAQAALAGGGQ
ncbi:MAG: hypothetical protein J7M21_02825 [Planctomycetes bacterium]|nr:hypothetical protein [Planctomycetota bacterium]